MRKSNYDDQIINGGRECCWGKDELLEIAILPYLTEAQKKKIVKNHFTYGYHHKVPTKKDINHYGNEIGINCSEKAVLEYMGSCNDIIKDNTKSGTFITHVSFDDEPTVFFWEKK